MYLRTIDPGLYASYEIHRDPNAGKFSREYAQFLILRYNILRDMNCLNLLMINARNYGPVAIPQS